MTTNSVSIPNPNDDNNHTKPPYFIEVVPEVSSKVENNEESGTVFNKCRKWMRTYANKFCGLHEERPKRLTMQEYLWSFIGAMLGIGAVAFFHFKLLEQHQLSFLIGSFGATAVLIFGTPRSPLAQPRNLIGGHLIGAICGCVVRVAIDRFDHSVACALAVASAIVVMQITETTHPPGGATALIAVTTQPLLPGANFLYIVMPTLTGALVMLFVALVINNMAPKRTYPCFWW